MTRYHMGINLGHERSVAIVKDGEIVVAIEQERLDRQKYSLGYLQQSPGDPAQMQLPLEAIRYCLEACNIEMADLATITGNMPGRDYAPEILRRVLPSEIAAKVQKIPSHHLAHAYSAYFPSGFEDALVLAVDATGTTNSNHQTESYTLYVGRQNTLSTLHSETVTAHLAGLSTLGSIYEYITRKAGFTSTVGRTLNHAEAGKLMGLAPFGKQQPNLQRWIHTIEDSLSLKISAYDIFLEVAALEKQYDDGKEKAYLRPYLVDLAYKVQYELEQALQHVVRLAVQQTGLKKLCIAGGVGLNSVANYQLLKQLELEDIFVFPAAGDSGIAAGCGLWAYSTIDHGQRRIPLKQATLGRSYSNAEVIQALSQFEDEIEIEQLSPEAVVTRSAKALAEGHILARFEGGSEYGPRALGHRSILADPTFRRMKDIVNARVKFREAFRPFAPVIPLETVSQVFEQSVAAPFMLLVSEIKPEFHAQIPAVTHVDGTGRVQTVTEAENPFFYRLCYRLVEERQGVPVLLNTSFNVAGQPIVETPMEAISTFLRTDIDFLVINNFWITKRNVPVLNYKAHLDRVGESRIPCGLSHAIPDMRSLMASLDRALFFGETENCPWSLEELRKLSAQGGKYKETSILFPETPFCEQLQTQLSETTVLLLDPLGQSTIVDLTRRNLPRSYTFEEVKLLLAVLHASSASLEQIRIESQLTTREFSDRIHWAQQQFEHYGISVQCAYLSPLPNDHVMEIDSSQLLAPFADETFSAWQILGELRDRLKQLDYTAQTICKLLNVVSQQHIEPTHLHYYDRYCLPHNQLGDTIRLFLLRVAIPEFCLQQIFGTGLFSALCDLGVLIQRDAAWASRIDLFDIDGLYIATDHRYMILPEDVIDEEPVMYVGLDSMGLVQTAPRESVDRVLDLCCGSGVQGLVASRYAKSVTSVDINPRAIRYARFNAQINGIRNIEFRLGNLYHPIEGQFDTILANPPFVPSPSQDMWFRDGGSTGEDILSSIIEQSANHLTHQGRLFIVTDLVNLQTYESKLQRWWRGGAAHQLVLSTADRNDILFSVPHCRAAFNQSYSEYKTQLDRWLHNFHHEGLTAINFGYILIQKIQAPNSSSYYARTIHNPTRPIHQHVQQYFQQRDRLDLQHNLHDQLTLSRDVRFRFETDPQTGATKIELFSPDNPYYTTYPINEMLYSLLHDIQQFQPKWSAYANSSNRSCLQDLIYKGIIHFTSRDAEYNLASRLTQTFISSRLSLQPSILGILELESESPSQHADDQPLSQPKHPISSPTDLWRIRELETKTTPTCLSSYLG
ncbi:MAG: methyltransferase [Leptolyngbya sp. UWPOB_LEPTO1]|uniref:carbamoyltransferase C-terminal domain-containing protein n=1 Tax=Leptolyngbya sp. UWPOB_LEPTO1 TaxID=2815653 RepID=UPI001AC4CA22|nr:carbamoyltransferase C-terminal domain-containing protein [Leptolyngbya sp. UWPOB_LEPTO1]MBN8564740.1 methyltransferase [Leptolyngbya sp. UWPOB_LEPTO1]